jgi:hypothetical protein
MSEAEAEIKSNFSLKSGDNLFSDNYSEDFRGKLVNAKIKFQVFGFLH